MLRSSAAVVAAAIAVLAWAAPALAATPFTAGAGAGHDVAVGLDGTAHVVWRTDEADDRIGYCRVPAGGSACDSESGFLTFPDASATAIAQGDVQVFAPAANSVLIFAGCTQCPAGDVGNNTFRWISANNGVSFTPNAVPVGELAFEGQGSYIGGDDMLGVRGSQLQAMDSALAPIALGGSSSGSPSAVPAASNEAVYAVNGFTSVKYRVFSGTMTPNNLNTIGNWSGDLLLPSPEADNEEAHLSSGDNGVLLSYLSTFSPGDARVGLRRYDVATNAFGPASYVQGPSPIDNNGLNFPHHSQDDGGRIHFVWRTLHDDGRLRYARSDDGGLTFSAPGNLATGGPFFDPLVEAGSAGTGFAVWATSGDQVRVVAIDPQPEPVAPGPGPGGGADTSPPGASGFGVGDSTLTPGQRTTFAFNASEAGLAVLTIQKQVKGLKLRKGGKRRCVPQTRRALRRLRRSAGSPRAYRRLLRKRSCKAHKRIGQIRRQVTAGHNEIAFNGRVAGRTLRRGRYRATLTITDAAGNVSRTETVRFRVIGRRARR